MEEQEEITPSPEYIKGFNEGYLLAQHEPELAAQMAKAEGTSERLQGIKDGHHRFTLERELDKTLANEQFKGQDLDSGKTQDRSFEPER